MGESCPQNDILAVLLSHPHVYLPQRGAAWLHDPPGTVRPTAPSGYDSCLDRPQCPSPRVGKAVAVTSRFPFHTVSFKLIQGNSLLLVSKGTASGISSLSRSQGWLGWVRSEAVNLGGCSLCCPKPSGVFRMLRSSGLGGARLGQAAAHLHLSPRPLRGSTDCHVEAKSACCCVLPSCCWLTLPAPGSRPSVATAR